MSLESSRSAADLRAIYEAVWRNMERENALVNFRLTWSILLSGGVLTAQALAVGQALALPAQSGPKALIFLLAMVLTCCALWFCRESGKGVLGALSQIDHLRRHYLTYAADFAALGLPRPFGDELNEKTRTRSGAGVSDRPDDFLDRHPDRRPRRIRLLHHALVGSTRVNNH